MAKNIIKNWEHGQKDLTLNTISYLITNLRGGESITIKAKAANTGIIFIGDSNQVSSVDGYHLDPGETMTLGLPITFDATNAIEIWGRAATAGDDVSFYKLIGKFPSTEASGSGSGQ